MFNSKMAAYKLEKPITTQNDYGENVTSFTAAGKVKMFISLSSESVTSGSDVRVNQSTHVGLTRDSSIRKGMRIGGKYIVEFVDASARDIIIYMKEVDNNGYYHS